jgi:carbon monoxide dehydrogenase subunit G
VIRYQGTIEAPVTKERFYEVISNPQKVVRFFPDVVESSIADQDHFKVKARVGAGPLKGTLDFDFETAEKRPGTHLKLKGRGQGMQSVVDLTLQMTFEDRQGGSKADWVAEAELGGLLASVGGRLIDGIAAKYMKQITENIRLEVSK